MKPPIPSPFTEPRLQEELNFPEPPLGDAICIRYKSTAAQLWRGHLRALFMVPFNLLWLTGCSFLLTLANYTLPWSFWPNWLAYLLFLFVVHEAGAWFMISNKLCSPMGTLTCLQRAGLFEIEPVNGASVKTTPHSWREMRSIRNINGTLFFIKFNRGIFIPCEAFRSPEEAMQFYEIAQRLRKSQGADWPDNAKSLQFGHWPTS